LWITTGTRAPSRASYGLADGAQKIVTQNTFIEIFIGRRFFVLAVRKLAGYSQRVVTALEVTP
jgi:hypothetical protein